MDFAIMAGVTWASRDFLQMLRYFVFTRTNCRSIANLKRLVCAFPLYLKRGVELPGLLPIL